MPGPKFSITVVGFISLLLATLAFYLEPSGNFLLRKTAEYGIEIPFVTSSRAIVCDVTRGIKYLGTLTSGVEHYQNIFYAEDTADKNRFAPPVKLTPLRGTVIDATKAGAWCPQGTGDVLPFTSKVVNVSENCLSLRIARPQATRADAKLPVVVWLHGGRSCPA
nr:secreted lipase [Quercus suber]